MVDEMSRLQVLFRLPFRVQCQDTSAFVEQVPLL